MTKTKAALCRALVRHWHLHGKMLDVIVSAWRDLHPGDTFPTDVKEFSNRLFGSQFVHNEWNVRTWLAANAKNVSDALFDGRSDDVCVRLAESVKFRRTKGARFQSRGGPKATHCEMPILMRSLSGKTDWNKCK